MGSCTHLGGWAHRGGPGRVWFGPHTGDGVRGPRTVPGGRLPGAFAPPLPPPGARSPPGSQLPPIAQPRLGRLGPSTLRHRPRAPLGNVLPRCTQGSQKSSFPLLLRGMPAAGPPSVKGCGCTRGGGSHSLNAPWRVSHAKHPHVHPSPGQESLPRHPGSCPLRGLRARDLE